VITYAERSSAPPSQAWKLIAEPARWHEWAPHVRGAWGLGAPEVQAGARGAVRLLGLMPVPAKIVDKQPGRSWTWRVGPVEMVHRVDRRRGGSSVAVDMSAPGPLEPALRAAYGPVVRAVLRRLARVAADPS
jgi:hypothetical protein